MNFHLNQVVDDKLRQQWHDLAEDVGTRFASRPSYGLSWHRHLARGPLRVATVHRDGKLVALLPLHQRRRLGVRVLRLLGHGLGTVGEALTVDDQAMRELVSGLAASGSALELTHLPEDAPLVTAVLADPAWSSSFQPDDHCPVIDLPTGTRARDLRSKSTISRAASTRRKLAREGHEFVVETVRDREEFEARWPDIATTAAAAQSDEGDDRLNLCAPPHDQFTREFLLEEAENGHLLLLGGTFGGRWGAQFATLRTSQTAELWFTRFDPAHRRVRPGHLLIEALCDGHDDVAVTRVDLLIGRSGYKTDWHTDEYTVGTLVAVPTRARTARARMIAADRAVTLLRTLAARVERT